MLARTWADYVASIVAECADEHPGTRPALWWQYDAPEPRKRLGCVGTPAHEVLANLPHYSLGIPTGWVTPFQVAYYGGTARDIHGRLINPRPRGTFDGVAIDPDDPPVFDSELRVEHFELQGQHRRAADQPLLGLGHKFVVTKVVRVQLDEIAQPSHVGGAVIDARQNGASVRDRGTDTRQR
jgi:hypothetical protein